MVFGPAYVVVFGVLIGVEFVVCEYSSMLALVVFAAAFEDIVGALAAAFALCPEAARDTESGSLNR